MGPVWECQNFDLYRVWLLGSRGRKCPSHDRLLHLPHFLTPPLPAAVCPHLAPMPQGTHCCHSAALEPGSSLIGSASCVDYVGGQRERHSVAPGLATVQTAATAAKRPPSLPPLLIWLPQWFSWQGAHVVGSLYSCHCHHFYIHPLLQQSASLFLERLAP